MGKLPQRKRRSVADWRTLLDEHAASGESVTVFCRRNNISETHLYRWRRRLTSTENETNATAKTVARSMAGNTAKYSDDLNTENPTRTALENTARTDHQNATEITTEAGDETTRKTTTTICAENSNQNSNQNSSTNINENKNTKAILPHSFIEVHLKEIDKQNELRKNSQDSGVTITLRESRKISLKVGFDSETFNRVVHALERMNA